MSRNSREAILSAARRQFEGVGYARSTIRDIAAEAHVSPGLVIKHFGSKADLYAEVGAPSAPLHDLSIPPAQLGHALVQRIVRRRDDGAVEPWLALVNTARDAERSPAGNPVVERWTESIARLIGDSTADRVHARVVIAQLVGLAEALNVLDLFAATDVPHVNLIDLYARAVQAQIDLCTGARS